jgi:hypothetical protein
MIVVLGGDLAEMLTPRDEASEGSEAASAERSLRSRLRRAKASLANGAAFGVQPFTAPNAASERVGDPGAKPPDQIWLRGLATDVIWRIGGRQLEPSILGS